MKQRRNWAKEFLVFLKSSPITPPRGAGDSLKRYVHADLNPSSWAVFCKLVVIHFVSGALTLFMCPQFGVAFNGSHEHALLNFFRSFGDYGCTLVCGAFFLAGTGLFAALLLRSQDIRVLRKSKFLQWGVLVLISIGFFLSFQEQEQSIPLGLAAAWLVGGLLGGISTFRISYELRSRVQARIAL
ncbi:hypothetical protein K2X33_09395 [bacterium]|nr:hypothetical protein [bacterium]